MRQIVVPQFIDVEDKIIGPITTRQFLIIIVGGIAIAIAYKTADMKGLIITSVVTLGLVVLFAFVKINGQGFHVFLVNFFETILKKPRLRVWDKEATKKDIKKEAKKGKKESEDLIVKTKGPMVKSRLTEIALVVDTGGVYQGEDTEI